MSDSIKLTSVISLPSDFKFDEVLPGPRTSGATPPVPALGPLAAFVGNWSGSGFNTIFRPDNNKTPTVLPVPVSQDNILELNLTSESLSFSPSLGNVPNRGTTPQGDIFLNGVPYLQAINDVTTGQSIGIHLEPGLWMFVPSTTDPAEGQTVVRMASIPHGTTILAQGTAKTINGVPTIPSVNITPFIPGSNPTAFVPFPSQTATNQGTARIPQDLTSFINNGSITQAMLDDPNTLLRNHISQQKIAATTQISISTHPDTPLFGGGAENIAFLQGSTPPPPPGFANAETLQMTATFWIETVEVTIEVPVFTPGQPPLAIKGQADGTGRPVPTFLVRPPIPIPLPRPITFAFTQIQYSQVVLLFFNGLTWPHVSVATLIPAAGIPVPPSAWA